MADSEVRQKFEAWIGLAEYAELREEIGRLEEMGECSCDANEFHTCSLCAETAVLDQRARALMNLWCDIWAMRLFAARKCPECKGERVVMTAAAGAGHADDLAEYCPCPNCEGTGMLKDEFAAGMRAGEIAMREKAAKTMESLSANWVSSLPMDEVQSLNCKQYARAIRALPLSGAEESKTS